MRVAYDISVLTDYFDRFDSKSGIYRVSEEVMYELNKRNDVELTAVGLCEGLSGDDFFKHSLRSYLYVKSREGRAAYRFDDSFRSGWGLTGLYRRVFGAQSSKGFAEVPRLHPKSVCIRGLARALTSLQVRNWTEITPAFDRKRYDVFHSPHYKLPPEELTAGVPRVLTIYDLIPIYGTEFVPPISTVNFKKILDSINYERDWIIAISEFTKREFCEYTGMSPDRVFVTPLAASNHLRRVDDAEQVAAMRRRYGIPEGNYILSLSSLETRRNLPHVLRCFFRLVSEQPNLNVNLVLAGRKGYMHDQILSAAEGAPGFRERVVVTDYVPDEDLSALYSGAKAFVYMSLYEGFGLPPLEAMQCGVPVIASNTSAIPEVVGDAGIMVNPHDADALCQAMLDLLTDSALNQELSGKGLERAKNFSWAKCAAGTAAVYKRAVAGR